MGRLTIENILLARVLLFRIYCTIASGLHMYLLLYDEWNAVCVFRDLVKLITYNTPCLFFKSLQYLLYGRFVM
jgi:hypothetical protein